MRNGPHGQTVTSSGRGLLWFIISSLLHVASQQNNLKNKAECSRICPRGEVVCVLLVLCFSAPLPPLHPSGRGPPWFICSPFACRIPTNEAEKQGGVLEEFHMAKLCARTFVVEFLLAARQNTARPLVVAESYGLYAPPFCVSHPNKTT